MTSDLPPPLPPALRLGGALWLVVGQTGPLSLSDSALLEQLSWLGAEVHTVRDAEFAVQPATRRWPGVHAAVISASVREGFLRGSPLVAGAGPSLPLVVMDGPAWLSLQLAGRHERVFGGSVQLVSDGHALAAGLRRGFVPLYEKPGRMAAALPCGGAQVVASAGSASGLGSPAILFGHEKGSALCGRGAVAPARRVALGIDAAGFAGMGRATPQASQLLAAALLWAAGAAEPAGPLGALQTHAAAVAGSEATLAEFGAYAEARQLMAREVMARKRPAGAAVRRIAAEATGLSPSGRACARLWPTGRACAAAATAARVAVLVHTCDAYAPFWPGWSRNFAAEWNASLCWPVYFAPEMLDPAAHVPLVGCGRARPLRTGGGEFSTRLLTALRALPTPHVLYLQEDSWLTGESEASSGALLCALALLDAGHFDGVRLERSEQLASGLYHLEETEHRCPGGAGGEQLVYRFAAHNRWLYSHQPGVWRRSFLLEGADGDAASALMQPGENPWLNELLASRRVEARHARVALLPLDWYVSVSSGGELNEVGRVMESMAAADASPLPVDLEVALRPPGDQREL